MSLKTGCACVHACAWTKLNAQEMHGNEVRGILQKKFRSQSFSGVEESYTRQRPFTPLWRVRADAVVVKSAVPNLPQTSKTSKRSCVWTKGRLSCPERAACPSFHCWCIEWNGTKRKSKNDTVANVSNFHFLTANIFSMLLFKWQQTLGLSHTNNLCHCYCC